MKPVDQTLFGSFSAPRNERGNCYPACIASILEIKIDDVPHFYAMHEERDPDDPDRDYRSIVDFMKSRQLCVATYNWPLHPLHVRGLVGQHVIVTGSSPRLENCDHAVIGLITEDGWRLEHDPHPSRDGIAGEPKYIEVLSQFIKAAA